MPGKCQPLDSVCVSKSQETSLGTNALELREVQTCLSTHLQYDGTLGPCGGVMLRHFALFGTTFDRIHAYTGNLIKLVDHFKLLLLSIVYYKWPSYRISYSETYIPFHKV